MTIDPERFMAVVEKHDVPLNFLCDLMPVVGLRLTLERRPTPTTQEATHDNK